MGGKSSSSTQQQTIPPDVLARYNSVNATAAQVAQTPFQTYGGQFVAPVNGTQRAGISGVAGSATEAQPFFAQAESGLGAAQNAVNPINAGAAGLTAMSAGPVNAQQIGDNQIAQFENPYLQQVLGSTEQLINQQNEQQASGQTGNAIQSGAFGGDRAGIAQANLAQQQDIAAGNVYSGIESNAFNTALGAAQQQQGVNLSAAQANRAALAAAGSQLATIGNTAYTEGANTASETANLGAGAQTAAQTGYQNELAAGTVEQQTRQAQDTALYNQFLQQQSYPFQTTQFLANIAEGTGALSGSTTTNTQPGGFFSDERLKEDVQEVGRLFDGQKIVRFRYKGDPRMRIGLIAQDVAKHHRDAVGTHESGYHTVDYGKATDSAADRGHFARGGLAPTQHRGGIIDISDLKPHMADGGITPVAGVGAGDINSVLNAQQAMYTKTPGSAMRSVPSTPAQHYTLPAPAAPPPAPASGLSNAQGLAKLGKDASSIYKGVAGTPAKKHAAPSAGDSDAPADAHVASEGLTNAMFDPSEGLGGPTDADISSGLAAAPAAVAAAPAAAPPNADGGRVGLAAGGTPYSDPDGALDIPEVSSNYQLQKPAPMPQAQSGLSQLEGLAGTAASIACMFAAGGSVRPGLAGGGDADDAIPFSDVSEANTNLATYAPDDDLFGHSPRGKTVAALPTNPAGQIGTKPLPPARIDPTIARASKPVPGLQPVPAAPTAPDTSAPPPGLATPDLGAQLDTQNTTPGVPAAAGLAPPAVPATSAPPAASAAPAASGAPTRGAAPPAASAGAPDAAPDSSSGLGGLGTSIKGKLGEIWDGMKHADSDTLQRVMPLLSGLAAMGTAPTRHLGVALAAGIGAGADSYMQTRQQNLEAAQIAAKTQSQNAGTNLTNIEAARRAGLLANEAFFTMDNGQPGVWLANGSSMTLQQWLAMDKPPATRGSSVALGAANNPALAVAKVGQSHGYGTPNATPSPGFAHLTDDEVSYLNGRSMAPVNFTEAGRATATKRTAEIESDLAARAADARAMGTQLTNFASTVSQSPDSGLSQGILQPWKITAARAWNDFIGSVGHSELAVDPQSMDNALIQNKLATGLQFAATQSSGQHAYEALRTASEANPSGQISRSAAAEMVANLMVEKQRAIDESGYESEARSRVSKNPNGYDASDARALFRARYSDQSYQKERDALVHMILARPNGGSDGSVLQQMLSGDKRYNPRDLEAAYDAPGLTRYFYNR